MASRTPTVAVIGLGVIGLVTVKNLLEEDFDVTGFDKNDYVGGLWHYTDEDKTSVLPTTVINISKERGCFTDFPFSDETPSHCTGPDVQRYLESYVEHFNLSPRLKLGTSVKLVKRDDINDRWEVHIEGAEEPQYFDKVVMAVGINKLPNIPDLVGKEIFKGECLHSRAFKRPELFKRKRVLVVGLGNTGADTCAALRGRAEKVYISHTHGSIVLPRVMNGIPFDHTMTARKLAFAGFLETNAPSVSEFMFNKGLRKMQNSTFKIQPEWRLSPAPSIKHAVPIVSDNLVDMFTAGDLQSVHGIKRATGPNEIELVDGQTISVDTIIYCTGYQTDFSLLDPAVDPTRHTTPAWADSVGSKGRPLPRLYQNVVSLDHPQSIAFMGCVAFATGVFPLYDLASMALAQIWKGRAKLPSLQEMNKAVDAQHAFICDIARDGNAVPGWVKQGEWLAWANETAGTGVNEKLGYGIEGWRFWLEDKQFCGKLMDGVLSPHVYRLFEGNGRKRWEGAREEIERVNRLSEALRQKVAAKNGG